MYLYDDLISHQFADTSQEMIRVKVTSISEAVQ